jgi:hypothetical protein
MRAIALNALMALLLLAPLAAHAQASEEDKVRAVIADWYERVSKTPADRPWAILAPGGIDGGPGYSVPADLNSGAAAIRGPWLNNELAARALQFRYDIDQLVVDAHLAKARVWERGYFYAWAAQKTYETAASALFILERQTDGAWKILAHEAGSQGIPPNRITDPMPDLRALHYERCGPACDPEADAKKAAAW